RVLGISCPQPPRATTISKAKRIAAGPGQFRMRWSISVSRPFMRLSSILVAGKSYHRGTGGGEVNRDLAIRAARCDRLPPTRPRSIFTERGVAKGHTGLGGQVVIWCAEHHRLRP